MKPRPLSEIPAKFHGEIMAQLLKPDPKSPQLIAAIPKPVARPRLRQDTKGPNKTELAFEAYLRERHPERTIHCQEITLTLANGVRYTPDFFVPASMMGHVFYETKGYMRDDASVKIKVAARVHQWASFYLVTKKAKKQGSGWQIERVLP